jgi:hypothetical protein
MFQRLTVSLALLMPAQLTGIIHESVGRNKQTQPMPELRSRNHVHRFDKLQIALDAFAQFRQ